MLSLLIASLFALPPVVDAAAFGVPSDQSVPAAAPLQLLVKPNTTIQLPAASLYGGLPVLITENNVTIRGRGEHATSWDTGVRGPSFIVGPLGDTTPDGFAFSAAGRPDLFGLADASLASAPGQAFGFDTQARTIFHSQANGFQLGAMTASGWDYWTGANGVTVEFLVAGKFTPGDRLLGLGTFTDPAEPVGFGAFFVASDRPNALGWAVAFEDEPVGTTHTAYFNGVDWSRPVRIRAWLDPATGEIGVWANGKSQSPSWYGPAPNLKGRRLRLNRKDFPFQFGYTSVDAAQGLAIPQVVLGGLRVSAVARRDAPGNDRASFLTFDAGTVCCFCVDRRDPGRLVRVKEGPGAENQEGFALALDARSPGANVGGFTLEDMTIKAGSPAVLLAQTFSPRIRRVTAVGGRAGIDTVRYGCNYPLRLEDCTLGGSNKGIVFYNTIASASNTIVSSGGLTSISLTASAVDWANVLFAEFGFAPETAVDLWGGGDFAFQHTLAGLTIDDEAGWLKVANIRAENATAGSLSLIVRNGAGAPVGPGKPVFLLSSLPGRKPAFLDVRGFAFPADGSSAVRCEGAKLWFGEVDTRGSVPPPAKPTGDGFAPSQLSVRSTP